MPMQRWIASAAGGTSQRLKPACATVRLRSRNPPPWAEAEPARDSEDAKRAVDMEAQGMPHRAGWSRRVAMETGKIAGLREVGEQSRSGRLPSGQRARSRIPGRRIGGGEAGEPSEVLARARLRRHVERAADRFGDRAERNAFES